MNEHNQNNINNTVENNNQLNSINNTIENSSQINNVNIEPVEKPKQSLIALVYLALSIIAFAGAVMVLPIVGGGWLLLGGLSGNNIRYYSVLAVIAGMFITCLVFFLTGIRVKKANGKKIISSILIVILTYAVCVGIPSIIENLSNKGTFDYKHNEVSMSEKIIYSGDKYTIYQRGIKYENKYLEVTYKVEDKDGSDYSCFNLDVIVNNYYLGNHSSYKTSNNNECHFIIQKWALERYDIHEVNNIDVWMHLPNYSKNARNEFKIIRFKTDSNNEENEVKKYDNKVYENDYFTMYFNKSKQYAIYVSKTARDLKVEFQGEKPILLNTSDNIEKDVRLYNYAVTRKDYKQGLYDPVKINSYKTNYEIRDNYGSIVSKGTIDIKI